MIYDIQYMIYLNISKMIAERGRKKRGRIQDIKDMTAR